MDFYEPAKYDVILDHKILQDNNFGRKIGSTTVKLDPLWFLISKAAYLID